MLLQTRLPTDISLQIGLLQPPKTHTETKQLHALSLKTNTFTHPSISTRLVSLYAHPSINNLHYVNTIFNNLQQQNQYMYNVLIKCHVENQLSQRAIQLFYDLLRNGYSPDSFNLPCVIKGCAKLGAFEEGKMVHGLVLKLGFLGDRFVQSSLVSLYGKCEDIESMRRVFDGVVGVKDLVIWNALLDGYVRCGRVELALQMFDEMPDKDLFSWTVLVDGFSRSGRVEEARNVFDWMPTRNLVSWNAMINGYMKAGAFDSARYLFDQMGERSLISWNSMIDGYRLNGRFNEGLTLFVSMLEEEWIVPSYATLVSVLSVVSGMASFSKGEWVHSYMLKHGFELDGVAATSLIDMYSKCGSIESALKVFEAIANKKLGHWTAIIVGLGMHGRAAEAFTLFQEMCDTGLRPNGITFVGVLNACSHAGLVDDGRRYFNMMINEYGIEPSIQHYGCLVDILCRAGCLEEAKDLIVNMPMRPNNVIWMSLLSGSRVYKNKDIGEYAANHVIELAPEAIGSYVLLSNIYAYSGNWNKVAQVRELMKKKGIKKDPGSSSVEHKGENHDFIVADKSHPQTEEIFSKLREMKEKLKLEGHIPDTSQVLLYIEGEEEKEAELEIHSERLAIAFGLINIEPGKPIRIMKNLRVCNDCHSVIKLLSKIYSREIIVRDNSRFHHFKNGVCSCKDFW